MSEVVTQVILPPAFRVLPTHLEFLDFRRTQLIFQPIPKPAVNDLPLLVANRAKIEKVGPFILQVSEEQKAVHHAGFGWVLFRPSIVFAKDGLSRLFFLHAFYVAFSQCTALPDFRYQARSRQCMASRDPRHDQRAYRNRSRARASTSELQNLSFRQIAHAFPPRDRANAALKGHAWLPLPLRRERNLSLSH